MAMGTGPDQDQRERQRERRYIPYLNKKFNSIASLFTRYVSYECDLSVGAFMLV